MVGGAKPSPVKVVFAALRSESAPTTNIDWLMFEFLVPGDHLLEGGEVGEAFLVGSQPKIDWW